MEPLNPYAQDSNDQESWSTYQTASTPTSSINQQLPNQPLPSQPQQQPQQQPPLGANPSLYQQFNNNIPVSTYDLNQAGRVFSAQISAVSMNDFTQVGIFGPDPHDLGLPLPVHTPEFGQNADVLRAREIMQSGLFCCLEDVPVTLSVFCCPCIVTGCNVMQSRQMPFLIGLLCHRYTCGLSRSGVQRYVGVFDQGCPIGCVVHACCPLCAISQETRAIKHLNQGLLTIHQQNQQHLHGGFVPPANVMGGVN